MKNILIASAHCDIPCGIYEPTVAKIAARTVARIPLTGASDVSCSHAFDAVRSK